MTINDHETGVGRLHKEFDHLCEFNMVSEIKKI